METNKWIFTALGLILVSQTFNLGLLAQGSIPVKNPSFEGIPNAGVVPQHWFNVGPETETAPDTQPGSFEVQMPAKFGNSYLGMVVRDNETWEGVGQKLESPLLKDSVYTFSLWLARSNIYRSQSKKTNQIANYISPTILKIWGVNSKNKTEELLAETTAISHSLWMQYSFELAPTVDNFDEINLMAYYAEGHELKNGNLLIDNCSDIIKK